MKPVTIRQEEAICALATAPGSSAIAVIRVSGLNAVGIVNNLFKGADLGKVQSHTAHFGTIRDGSELVDEVLVTVFRSPTSFTREDAAEISCHGSGYIIRKILKLLVTNGCRMAMPGEFTQRAYLNGQLDLVQAEAVADLIAADSAVAHRTALHQLRGGFSRQLTSLREELIHFASLIELELDFGEEDVEFAGRDDLRRLVNTLIGSLAPLIESFGLGNALKEGIPVAIIGAPNVGKSTLLNALLNEEKAIVTEIAGTTRDIIEDTLYIGGLKFRIIDTAGIRETSDIVESMGIERSKRAMEKADVILFLFDGPATLASLEPLAAELPPDKKVVWVRNKMDIDPLPVSISPPTPPGDASEPGCLSLGERQETSSPWRREVEDMIYISAATGTGLDELKNKITGLVSDQDHSGTVVTNLRHYEHLVKTQQALREVLYGLDKGITGDFLAQDIRLALFHLGEITGTIATDDLLANIFSRFCIGK